MKEQTFVHRPDDHPSVTEVQQPVGTCGHDGPAEILDPRANLFGYALCMRDSDEGLGNMFVHLISNLAPTARPAVRRQPTVVENASVHANIAANIPASVLVKRGRL